MAKSSSRISDEEFGKRRGTGGCAIMWHNTLSNNVRALYNDGTDRMCVLQVKLNDDLTVYVIAVYLPHQSCTISDFNHEPNALRTMICEYSAKGSVLVIGDMNVHLGSEYG